MPTTLIAKIVDAACRHAWAVVGAFALLVLLAGAFAASRFAISTDVGKLIDPHTDWARRDAAIAAAFPGRSDTTLVVVRAPAPEFAAAAARELAARLRARPDRFQAVSLGAGSEFFRRNGLLYLPAPRVARLTGQLIDARPLLNALARDPSLRGLANLLSVSLLAPLQSGRLTLAGMAPLLERSSATVEAVLAGRPAALSWQDLADAGPGGDDATADGSGGDGSGKLGAAGAAAATGGGAAPALIEVRPVLDFSELMPGAPSSAAIRAAAADLRLAARYHAGVALTGPIPLADDEFASLQEGSALAAVAPVLLLACILWRALRAWQLVLAVLLTMLGGLVITAALGLLMVGELNVISIAFAILFVGIGVDFGIQFGMRFRELRRHRDGAGAALHDAARAIALPLALAAAATACGFLSFLPTAYRGVAELGQIAGAGILLVAFPSCLTVLPALICLLAPPPSASAPGYPRLAPLDRALQAHRKTVLGATLALVAAGSPLLWQLRFDADPLHLKDPASESMAALRALDDGGAGAGIGIGIGIDNIQVLAASPAAARALAQRLARLPEVGAAMSVADLVPDGQDGKLRHIGAAAAALLPLLSQAPLPAASDIQRVTALRAAARALRNAALDHPGAGAAQATRLATALAALARADPAVRERAEHALAAPLALSLATLRLALQAGPVTLAGLPDELRRNWIAADGRALVDVSPRPEPRGAGVARAAPGGAAVRADRARGGGNDAADGAASRGNGGNGGSGGSSGSSGGSGSSGSSSGGSSSGSSSGNASNASSASDSTSTSDTVSRQGDARLRAFARAVLRVAPEAGGGTVSVQGAAQLIVDAFRQAALLAVLTITLLLWLALRRFGDVLRTMLPLLVSALVTLEACVLLGIQLNFANIIALPLLLGVGVAFKIYYVMAWRSGEAALLQHALTQAIVLSAATTATAFGSLWLSHHPGTASMGELLVLSLVCTLVGAVFFQPVLLGRPRRAQADRSGRAGPRHN